MALACAMSRSSEELEEAGLGEDATYSTVLFVWRLEATNEATGESRTVKSTTGTARNSLELGFDGSTVCGGVLDVTVHAVPMWSELVWFDMMSSATADNLLLICD